MERQSSIVAAFAAKLSLLTAALIGLDGLAAPAFAQVAITTGVQQIWDDNIYLENDRRRPAPFVANNGIEDDLRDGELSVLYTEQTDGKPNDDMITNAFIDMSTNVRQIEHYAETLLSGRVGGLFFADQSDESRLTLDGSLDMRASEHIIPDPFFLELHGVLSSESTDVAVAEGTAAGSTETVTGSGRFGYRDEILRKTTLELAYTGAYHAVLGDLRFSDADTSPAFDTEGADYHAHTASTTLDYEVNNRWIVGVAADVGKQIFTNVDGGGETGDERLAGQSDRTNANVAATTSYMLSQDLFFRGSAGIGLEKLDDTPLVVERTIIGDNGQPITIRSEPDDSNEAFTFSAYLDYTVTPGSLLSAGAIQTLSTDIDGDPIITRSFFANATWGITDRLVLLGGSTFTQFSTGDSLSQSTDRIELSASISYSLTQNIALLVGYNYLDQNADETVLDEALRFTSLDYTGNRVFVGINMGLVGLPL